MRRALLVIAKRPEAGQTKTRLSPPLSGEEATALYEAFLRDSLELARAIPDVERFVLYLPQEAAGYFGALAPDFGLILQQGADLGARLDHALSHCLSNGFAQALVMDSDSPTLPPAYIAQAFAGLGEADAVFGPCDDGGYYLVAARRPLPELLLGVRMSTPNVLRDTLALARQHSVRVALTPAWYDIDTVADLARLRAELAAARDGIGAHTRAFLAAQLLLT